jgi:hypothetical protein
MLKAHVTKNPLIDIVSFRCMFSSLFYWRHVRLVDMRGLLIIGGDVNSPASSSCGAAP